MEGRVQTQCFSSYEEYRERKIKSQESFSGKLHVLKYSFRKTELTIA